MSLGFETAGCELVGGVEFDPIAARTYAQNFHSETLQSLALHGKPRDITRVEPDDLVRELGGGLHAQAHVDVIIGGPPCQAFARVGRAKLREIASSPDAYRQDDRAKLYTNFLHYIQRLQPLMVVMENVPDILNYGGHNIAEEICETLDDVGYKCRYTLLNSVFYGVPQMRERFFLIAVDKRIGAEPGFPQPSHWHELPPGYQGARQVAFKSVGKNGQRSFLSGPYFVEPPVPDEALPRAVTASEAIGDLPEITLHLEGRLRRGTRHFDTLACYRPDILPSPYAMSMRRWEGFESGEGVYDHVIRSLPRDYAIFRRMRRGDQYPQAHQHALDLFAEALSELTRRGEDIPVGSVRYRELYSSIVPPYDPGKFPNKWRKLDPNQPSRTLMAHLGKDSYSHIHYDDAQARTISVREAARLQSFPDGFRFAGTMNPAFRQIGNAVPPLLAWALAECLLTAVRVNSRVQENRSAASVS